MREHSQLQLKQKLMAKGFLFADIEPVLMHLAAQNWQSDSRFAQSYSRYRVNKGYGEVFIRYQLTQKGVASAIINNALAEIDVDWFGLLTQVYQKKYGNTPIFSRQEQIKRQRFLMQRGFTGELITRLLSRLAND